MGMGAQKILFLSILSLIALLRYLIPYKTEIPTLSRDRWKSLSHKAIYLYFTMMINFNNKLQIEFSQPKTNKNINIFLHSMRNLCAS